jgi:hypothetical protein
VCGGANKRRQNENHNNLRKKHQKGVSLVFFFFAVLPPTLKTLLQPFIIVWKTLWLFKKVSKLVVRF